jgi:hypothetical protein
VYKAYIRLALQNGCEALATAIPAILNKLELMQNEEALRLVMKLIHLVSF